MVMSAYCYSEYPSLSLEIEFINTCIQRIHWITLSISLETLKEYIICDQTERSNVNRFSAESPDLN
jgi:hypothetical protein